MPLLLNRDEREVLTDLLQQAHSDLRAEISRTEGHDFRMELKKREKTLESVLQKLQQEGVVEPAA